MRIQTQGQKPWDMDVDGKAEAAHAGAPQAERRREEDEELQLAAQQERRTNRGGCREYRGAGWLNF